MYKDRNHIPHQLSYSSVTNYQPNKTNNNYLQSNNDNNQFKESIKQSRNRNVQVQQNNDLSFLRNTMGPKYFTTTNPDMKYLKTQDKTFDSSLRQTTGNLLDIRQKIKVYSPIDNKKKQFTQTTYQPLKTNRQQQSMEGSNRLQKIMNKYQKKNQTKQALKLLEQLKQLKKKQQQLKKQRKNESKKQQQLANKKTNFQCNSPINFTKKNKVQYYTPTNQKKDTITNAISPPNDTYIPIKKQFTNISSNNNNKNIYQYEQNLSSSRSQYTNNNVNNENCSKSPISSNINVNKYYEDKQAFTKKYSNYLNSNTPKYSQKNYQSMKLDLSNVSDTTSYNNRSNKQQTISPIMTKKSQPYQSYNSLLTNSTSDKSKREISKSPTNNKLYLSTTSSTINNSKYLSSNHSIQSTNSIQKNNQTIQIPSNSLSSMNSNSSVNVKKQNFLNRKVSINDFILGKSLGQGKFGTVYQALDRKTKSLYALKKVPKAVIKSHWMIDQFILQVKLQAFLNHPNILSLFTTFDDTDNVYILLEYMEQGTLFLELKKNQILDQKQAAIKLKQIAAAIQYLHQNNIAHRDIKPQNIVMSHGVCKLCDFGWSTICDQRRKTYCGTFDYAAPEILQGEQYDMSVDLWCLGILAYQLMVGKAPFYHISRKQTMKKIMNVQNQKINYPSTMSKQAKSFIQQLLKKNPAERLKSEDLLNHSFLRNIPQ